MTYIPIPGQPDPRLHQLTHRSFTDGALTPACTCGWWSPRREHADFERHLARVRQAEPS